MSNQSTTPNPYLAAYMFCNEFCELEAIQSCNNTVLFACPQCNAPAIVSMAIALILLGILGVVGNILVIAVSVQNFRLLKISKQDPIKLSLAVSNLLLAIQIFAVLLPKFVSLYSSNGYTYYFTPTFYADGNACGFLLIVCTFGCLYHLLYLGLLRFFAIFRPIKYSKVSPNKMFIGVGIVWVMSFIAASFPGWFQNDSISYCITSYVCFMCEEQSYDMETSISYLVIVFFVPFAIMTILNITTSVLSYIKLNKFKKDDATAGSRSEERNQQIFSQQLAVFKTVTLMQIAFTITIVPIIVDHILLDTYGNCFTYIDRELGGILLILANDVLYPIIYLLREDEFRKSIVTLFQACGISCECKRFRHHDEAHAPSAATAETRI